jgi:hypothetical protein
LIFSLSLSARSFFLLELDIGDSISSIMNISWDRILFTTLVMVRVGKSFSKRSALTLLYLGLGSV